jgi:hypothetical protein
MATPAINTWLFETIIPTKWVHPPLYSICTICTNCWSECVELVWEYDYLSSFSLWSYGLSAVLDHRCSLTSLIIYFPRIFITRNFGVVLAAVFDHVYFLSSLIVSTLRRHFDTVFPWAGIFKQSMGVRNRVGIGLSYRPATLHRLAELIPWNRFLHNRLKVRALVFITQQREIDPVRCTLAVHKKSRVRIPLIRFCAGQNYRMK